YLPCSASSIPKATERTPRIINTQQQTPGLHGRRRDMVFIYHVTLVPRVIENIRKNRPFDPSRVSH
ncbi:MAG: hypothetical protein ABR986_09865, partial [Methanomassiliicoccales archaeon]